MQRLQAALAPAVWSKLFGEDAAVEKDPEEREGRSSGPSPGFAPALPVVLPFEASASSFFA